jgi:hypothetical protein
MRPQGSRFIMKRLLLLVTILAQTLFPLVRGNLVAFPLPSARHGNLQRLLVVFSVLNSLLESLSRLEDSHAAVLQPDRFTGTRIARGPRTALLRAKNTEAAKLDTTTLAELVGHSLQCLLKNHLHFFP